jgi:hypothetical protein
MVDRRFIDGGSGPVDWPSKLREAQRNARGDPLTGAFYVLDDDGYQLFQDGKVVEECGQQVAIAFDAATRQVLKHGDPEQVEQYAINARKAYVEREDDIRHLVPTLAVVWMPPRFDPEEINRVLVNPIYLLELMAKAQKVKRVGDAAPPRRRLPSGEIVDGS